MRNSQKKDKAKVNQRKEKQMSKEKILVLNFGGQYDQLIVRRVREMGVFAELEECDSQLEDLDLENLAGIILTGGPQSVNNDDSPKADKKIFDLGVPVLGICLSLIHI